MNDSTITTILMTIMSLVMGGLIPWAYVIERRLSRIEARLTNGLNDRICRVEQRLETYETQLHKAAFGLELHLQAVAEKERLEREKSSSTPMPGTA